MEKYTKIYDYFLKRIKNKEVAYWNNNCQSFFIDAFKVLLAGHYMAHNIVCLERLNQENGGTYTYQHGVYNITWKEGTIKKNTL